MAQRISTLPGTKLLRAYGRFLQNSTKVIAEPALRMVYGVRSFGAEVIPKYGPAVITPNHLSFIDPFFVALTSPRPITFIGKAEYFDSWQTRWFFELAGVIPVRREDSNQARGSLDAGADELREGHLLGIFPEGTRSPDGRLYKGKTGAARMALEVGCPVIPTGIVGTRQLLPKDAKIPSLGPRITVRYGTPMRVPREAGDNPRALRTFTDKLMEEIARLTRQTYRHRYAYNKRIGQPADGLAQFSG